MRLWRKVLAFFFAGAFLVGLWACGGPGEGQSGGAADSAGGDTMEVTDLAGRSVAIPAGTDSFACIGPGCLRLYCYVGEQSQLAGVEDVEKTWGETGRPYAMALERLEELDTVGPGGPGSAPDAERLLASGADVVFSTYAMEPAEIQELQDKLSIPVVALGYGEESLFSQEVDRSLELLGQITGREERAQEVVNYFAQAKADLESRAAGAQDPPTVYLGCQSYQGSHGIESTTGDSPIFDALHARNVVEEAGIDGYVTLDKEKLLELDPDFLIIDGGGLSVLQEDYTTNPDFYESLSAVKQGDVYLQLPFNYYGTNLEIALANAYYIGTALYPEAFTDVDPAEKFDEICQALLGIDAYETIAETYFGGYQRLELGK